MAYIIQYDEKKRPILPTQHPDADLDYGVSFRTRLAGYGDGDTIANFTVETERGVTIYSKAADDYNVTWWMKDGKADNDYIVVVTALTVNGRTIPYELVVPFGYNQVELEYYE